MPWAYVFYPEVKKYEVIKTSCIENFKENDYLSDDEECKKVIYRAMLDGGKSLRCLVLNVKDTKEAVEEATSKKRTRVRKVRDWELHDINLSKTKTDAINVERSKRKDDKEKKKKAIKESSSEIIKAHVEGQKLKRSTKNPNIIMDANQNKITAGKSGKKIVEALIEAHKVKHSTKGLNILKDINDKDQNEAAEESDSYTDETLIVEADKIRQSPTDSIFSTDNKENERYYESDKENGEELGEPSKLKRSAKNPIKDTRKPKRRAVAESSSEDERFVQPSLMQSPNDFSKITSQMTLSPNIGSRDSAVERLKKDLLQREKELDVCYKHLSEKDHTIASLKKRYDDLKNSKEFQLTEKTGTEIVELLKQISHQHKESGVVHNTTQLPDNSPTFGIREKDSVYIGHGIWVNEIAYDIAMNEMESGAFVTTLSYGVWGPETLAHRVCRQQSNVEAKELTPTKKAAVVRAFTHWMKKKKMPEEIIKFNTNRVRLNKFFNASISAARRKIKFTIGRAAADTEQTEIQSLPSTKKTMKPTLKKKEVAKSSDEKKNDQREESDVSDSD